MTEVVLLVGAAAGVLSLALARGTILEGFRTRCGEGLLGELVSCPFCLAAWLSALLWLWRDVPRGLDWIVAWGASWAAAAATAGLLERILSGGTYTEADGGSVHAVGSEHVDDERPVGFSVERRP